MNLPAVRQHKDFRSPAASQVPSQAYYLILGPCFIDVMGSQPRKQTTFRGANSDGMEEEQGRNNHHGSSSSSHTSVPDRSSCRDIFNLQVNFGLYIDIETWSSSAATTLGHTWAAINYAREPFLEAEASLRLHLSILSKNIPD